MKYLPEPQDFWVERTTNYSNDGYYCSVTPYKSLDWQALITKYGIQIPEIMDMSCGKSKCPECGAVYSGHQIRCNRIIEWSTMPNSWSEVRGYRFGAEKILKKECIGYTKWDIQEQFDTQREFFQLLDRIICLPLESKDQFLKFKGYFPASVMEHLSARLIASDVENIKTELSMIKDGIKMIAQKMNSAGACLTFGF